MDLRYTSVLIWCQANLHTSYSLVQLANRSNQNLVPYTANCIPSPVQRLLITRIKIVYRILLFAQIKIVYHMRIVVRIKILVQCSKPAGFDRHGEQIFQPVSRFFYKIMPGVLAPLVFFLKKILGTIRLTGAKATYYLYVQVLKHAVPNFLATTIITLIKVPNLLFFRKFTTSLQRPSQIIEYPVYLCCHGLP